MRRYRFSIQGLMAFIVIVALGLVALRTPSRIWTNAWYSLAMVSVPLAVSAAVGTVAERRAFWIGFACSGGVYFAFTLAPWVGDEAGHHLITTAVLDLAAPHIIENRYLIPAYIMTMNPPAPPVDPSAWQVWNLPDFRTSSNRTWSVGYVTLHSPPLYLRIGHGLFTLIAGLIGGEVARFLHLKRPSPRPERTHPG